MTPDPITTAADFTRLLEAEMRMHLGDAHLTLSRYATLVRAHGLTVADLAPQLNVSEQMVSKTVRELKLLDYVIPVPSVDRRRRVLHVTPAGRAALALASALRLPPPLLSAMQVYVAQQS